MENFALIFGLIANKVHVRTFLQNEWVLVIVWITTYKDKN